MRAVAVSVVVAAVMVAAPASAHADDGAVQVGGDLAVGIFGDMVHLGIAPEVTYRLAPDLPFYLRGRLAITRAGQFGLEYGSNGGFGVIPQVGIEARGCTGEDLGACAIGGATVGVALAWTKYAENDQAGSTRDDFSPFAGLSVGFDGGGDTWRFRVLLDGFETQATVDNRETWMPGLIVSIGLVRQL